MVLVLVLVAELLLLPLLVGVVELLDVLLLLLLSVRSVVSDAVLLPGAVALPVLDEPLPPPVLLVSDLLPSEADFAELLTADDGLRLIFIFRRFVLSPAAEAGVTSLLSCLLFEDDDADDVEDLFIFYAICAGVVSRSGNPTDAS